VEKPISVTSDQGLILIKKAKQAGVKFTVAENTRFVKAYREAENLLQSGELGTIWLVRAYVHGTEIQRLNSPSSWVGKKPFGGVILDSGVHTFYLFKWLFGGVRDLKAIAFKAYPAGQMEDNAIIMGHLANNVEFITFQSCTVEIPWTERLEVYGSQGGLVIDQLVSPPARVYTGKEDAHGRTLEDVPYDHHWKHHSVIEEVQDFVQAVLENRDPLIDPMDACYAVKVVEAAYRSAENNASISIS
jgi:predicted dehydrogenase